MAKKKAPNRLPLLEAGLQSAMQAIDNQVAREMQRDPAARAEHGVQKWEPFAKRVELITGFVMQEVGTQSCSLDAVLVLAQAYAKSLALLVEDLEEGSLGTVRSGYCRETAKAIESDVRRIRAVVEGVGEEVMN